ncbi:MAG: DUF499 domain-containing protein [Myxococcales bacterium]|nr:DUF499 domain-containing protein [Myxococcales bacterium]
MLAVLHLASRNVPLKKLHGLDTVLDAAQVKDVPKANVAVLDGNEHSPGQSWKRGKLVVRTLWGELAWQLGGAEGFELVRESDERGSSPGKEVLRELLQRSAPCVVLMDELVAWVRQFKEVPLSGGNYDSNLSFLQALTEAVKLVPNAVLLASLPESDAEAGSDDGVRVLKNLEKVFGRLQAIWKPVASTEAFEIVRRRLFEPITDTAARDETCKGFVALYESAGAAVPSFTHESRYADELRAAYPIHPEVFRRLYEGWSPLPGFQRTRGVLKLMAHVIHRLWADKDADAMILAGSLPLFDPRVRSELINHLPPGWDPVVERDIDGNRSETVQLDLQDTRFGEVQAARRVARALFLATAPSSAGVGKRSDVNRAEVMLGVLLPGQSHATYRDALLRLTERLHHLNLSGDKEHESTTFWFDTRATLRREMEDRRNQLEGKPEVVVKMKETLEGIVRAGKLFDGVHVFTPHADVPDDGFLRMVVLDPSTPYSKDEPRLAFDAVQEFLKQNGSRPRHRANRLLFLAPELATLDRLRVNLRTAMAWQQILDAIEDDRLVIDKPQARQAEKERDAAEASLGRVARECFKWLLVPRGDSPSEKRVEIETYPLAASVALEKELERTTSDNELVISKWSPLHLRELLKSLYWKAEQPHIGALAVWSDSEKYLYLPRLRDRTVFEETIREGLRSTEFFGAAFGEKNGAYEGLRLGDGPAQLDDTLLLIEPEVAAAKRADSIDSGTGERRKTVRTPFAGSSQVSRTPSSGQSLPVTEVPATRFFAQFEVKPSAAKLALAELHDELIRHFIADPDAKVTLRVELTAELPEGASAQLRRVTSENADKVPNVALKSGGVWEE